MFIKIIRKKYGIQIHLLDIGVVSIQLKMTNFVLITIKIYRKNVTEPIMYLDV